jgi:hypothetical protein
VNLIGKDAEHGYGDDFKAEPNESHDVRGVIPAIKTNTNQQMHARKKARKTSRRVDE